MSWNVPWSKNIGLLGCRRPLPDRWRVGATQPLSDPVPVMPPLPAGGEAWLSAGIPRTPSASRGCPWTGPLAIEASGTPHACAPAALGPTVPLSSLASVVRPVFRQRVHLSLPAALPLSWPPPPQPRRLPVPRLPSGRRLACGWPAASSAGQPLARLGEGSRWHGGTRAGGGEAPAGVPRE